MAIVRAKTQADAIRHFKAVFPVAGKQLRIVRKVAKGKYEILTKGHKSSSKWWWYRRNRSNKLKWSENMAGTIEELIKIKEEALESIPNLTKEELFLFNEFLIDLLKSVNREMRHIMKELN